MGLEEFLNAAQEMTQKLHEKYAPADTQECGCIPLGEWVARLTKRWPSDTLIQAGELDTEAMDRRGALPVLTIYRPDQPAVVIQGRTSIDALADLLTSNGYGVAGQKIQNRMDL